MNRILILFLACLIAGGIYLKTSPGKVTDPVMEVVTVESPLDQTTEEPKPQQSKIALSKPASEQVQTLAPSQVKDIQVLTQEALDQMPTLKDIRSLHNEDVHDTP